MDINVIDDKDKKTKLTKSLPSRRRIKDVPYSNDRLNKGVGILNNSSGQSHSFLTDVADVRQMEQGLLRLLDDFHSGRLQAFGQDITFEKMENVREQQEKLAKLHFDLNNQQELYGHDTEDGRKVAKENMSKLIESLKQLSSSM